MGPALDCPSPATEAGVCSTRAARASSAAAISATMDGMSPGSRSWAGRSAALLLVASIAGCDKDASTQPTAPPVSTRQVAVTVENPTGTRIVGANVTAVRLDFAGQATVASTTT